MFAAVFSVLFEDLLQLDGMAEAWGWLTAKEI